MHKRGFTIIETFVAVTILLVAVLGPLSILGRAVADETYLKNQLIATYLAQEGVELVVNKKDNNMVLLNAPIEGGTGSTVSGWLAGLEECDGNQGCQISYDDKDDIFLIRFEKPSNGGAICFSGLNYTNCDSVSPNTPFNRVVMIEESEDPPRAGIRSVVTWSQRGISRTVEVKTTVYEYEGSTF